MPNRNEIKVPELKLKSKVVLATVLAFTLKVVGVLAITASTTLMGAAAGAVVGFLLPLALPMWKLGAVVAFVSNVWKEAQ